MPEIVEIRKEISIKPLKEIRKSVYTHNPPVKVIILNAAQRILESNEMEKTKHKNKTKATNVHTIKPCFTRE